MACVSISRSDQGRVLGNRNAPNADSWLTSMIVPQTLLCALRRQLPYFHVDSIGPPKPYYILFISRGHMNLGISKHFKTS